jgi:DNA processing protein
MKKLKEQLIYLHHCKGMGWESIYKLLKSDPSLKSIQHMEIKEKQLTLHHSHLPRTISTRLESPSESIQEQIRQYALNGIQCITIFDEQYPSLLKEIYQPPWVLYVKGDPSLFHKGLKLAVVGSRQATAYGKMAIKEIIPKLVEKNVIIVSGLATGVDALAHETAINCGGSTIGVIAGGLFHIYPEQNKALALKIMEHHLLISEYPPNTKPSKWQFPMRNRIISGLSRGTFIVEAKRKSGSLITANYALNEGREVFALPGHIFSPYSVGTNDLIRQGAKLVTSSEDILEEFDY